MPKAIVFDQPGPPSVLRWQEVPQVVAAAREVTIGIEAAGVNNADLMRRRGKHWNPGDRNYILGLECAGRITGLGADVTEFALGDRVCALLDRGGYADEVAVAVSQVLPIPAGLDFLHASVVPEAACTVYSNLHMIAHLRAGQSVLVHGATGGIGTFAVQWAHAIGARVIATAGSDDRAVIGRELGASVAINYKTTDFVSAVLDATDGIGVDVILDVVGAAYLNRNLQCLATDGHLVIINGTGGRPELDLDLMLRQRANISATLLNPRPPDQKAAIVSGVREHILPLLNSGAIQPVVDTVVALAEASKAHALLESGAAAGRVVLDNRSDLSG